MRRLSNWFNNLSLAGRVATLVLGSIVAFGVMSAAVQPKAAPATEGASQTESRQVNIGEAQPSGPVAETVPITEHKTVTATEAVPFTSSTVDDSAMAQGTTNVQTVGVNGIRTVAYEVTYTNGAETSRKEISSQVTTKPINEVIAKGTKTKSAECPHGTYTNSFGNRVCRPYE